MVTVAGVAAVVTENPAEVSPAGTVTEAGIVIGPLAARAIVIPGDGAGEERVTVQLEAAPASTGLGEQERDDSRTGASKSSRDVRTVEPNCAVITAGPDGALAEAVAENTASV